MTKEKINEIFEKESLINKHLQKHKITNAAFCSYQWTRKGRTLRIDFSDDVLMWFDTDAHGCCSIFNMADIKAFYPDVKRSSNGHKYLTGFCFETTSWYNNDGWLTPCRIKIS